MCVYIFVFLFFCSSFTTYSAWLSCHHRLVFLFACVAFIAFIACFVFFFAFFMSVASWCHLGFIRRKDSMLLITSRRIVDLGGYNNSVSALQRIHPLASFFVPFLDILRWLTHCARSFFLRQGSSLQLGSRAEPRTLEAKHRHKTSGCWRQMAAVGFRWGGGQ